MAGYPCPRPRGTDIEVAAFHGPRLRHFQKQGSVKEKLKKSGSRVQVELKVEQPGHSKSGALGVRTGNAVTGVPRSRVRISPAPPLRLVAPEAVDR